jgi:phospholipase/carboxylesterase
MTRLRHRAILAGELTTHVIDQTDTPSQLVVLCHGFGAPGTDLVPLAEELVALSPNLAETTRFAFPEAPLDLAGMGFWQARAWFPIDIESLDMAQRSGRTDLLASAEPAGMKSARHKLERTVSALLADAKLPWSALFLGGFSQGAMMALDLALRHDEAAAGVIAYSPTLVDRATWEKRAAIRRGLRVLISHGRQDPLLPFSATEGLVSLLAGLGPEVEFVPFDGPHTIAQAALVRSAALLSGPR